VSQRFSGPQILRFRELHSDAYKQTSRISLVSSFVASIFLGAVAPIDISDVCGANLWDIKNGRWHEDLLATTAGDAGVEDLKAKLGNVPADGGKNFGTISPYFVKRYGFSSEAKIVAFTGDNPSTLLALPLRSSDAIVSLGTSTTFLMSTPQYKPDPAYHFLNHPTTSGLYMFMLCYKNGGLAREHIRDAINNLSSSAASKSWDSFNETATATPVLGQKDPEKDPARLGLFFPRPEIVPNVKAGTWRFLYKDGSLSAISSEGTQEHDPWPIPKADARAILESQFLSLRLRSQNLVENQGSLPAQPHRIYLVGGGAANSAIAELAGQVLGGSEGVYKLDIGGNACALGAAYKAAWGVQRQNGERFEDFLEARWNEEGFVRKIAEGYRKGVFERYGDALKGFAEVEGRAIQEKGEGKLLERNAGEKVS
jgi:xylulokinase